MSDDTPGAERRSGGDAARRESEAASATFDPQIELKAGDKLRVECTYMNPGAEAVRFGNSSLEEMCFASSYRYPASGKSPVCIF